MSRYFNNAITGLSTIWEGMKITFRHLFKPAVTIQYPEVRLQLPERERNRLYVNMDDCIGCDQCARACPVDCITIETVKSLPTEDLGKTSNGKKKVLWVTQFDIDLAKCCYCQLCVFPCPTECIYMTDVFEFSELERNNLVYSYITLTQEEIKEKRDNYAQLEAEKAAKKAAAAEANAKADAQKKKDEEEKSEQKPEEEKENKEENKSDSDEREDNTGSSDKKEDSDNKPDENKE